MKLKSFAHNQYANNLMRSRERYVTAVVLLSTVVASLGCRVWGLTQSDLLSPLPAYAVETVRETRVEDHCRHPKTVEQMIDCKFGLDAPKARKLLTCENKSLNPNASNHNTDGSTDYGVFQINSYWQGVSNTQFLKDPEINVALAYNIYHRSGNSFKLWSCGKRMGL